MKLRFSDSIVLPLKSDLKMGCFEVNRLIFGVSTFVGRLETVGIAFAR